MGSAAGRWSKAKIYLLRKTKWRLWSGLVNVWTGIWLRWCGMTWKPSNVAELQQFCNDVWAKIPPRCCKRPTVSYCKRLISVAAAKSAVISFRGRSPFYMGHVGLDISPCNKKLCLKKDTWYPWLTFKLVWCSETFKSEKRARNGPNTFSHHCTERWLLILSTSPAN